MSEREQLRSALASRLSMRSDVDAVLAVLDQQGWQPGPTDDECIAEYDRVTPNGQTMLRSTKVKVGRRMLAECDAALACVQRLRTGWFDGGYEWVGQNVRQPMTKAEQEAMASPARQVTEAGEG